MSQHYSLGRPCCEPHQALVVCLVLQQGWLRGLLSLYKCLVTPFSYSCGQLSTHPKT